MAASGRGFSRGLSGYDPNAQPSFKLKDGKGVLSSPISTESLPHFLLSYLLVFALPSLACIRRPTFTPYFPLLAGCSRGARRRPPRECIIFQPGMWAYMFLAGFSSSAFLSSAVLILSSMTLRLHFYYRLIPTAPSQIGSPAEALWLLFKLQLVTQGCSYESA